MQLMLLICDVHSMTWVYTTVFYHLSLIGYQRYAEADCLLGGIHYMNVCCRVL